MDSGKQTKKKVKNCKVIEYNPVLKELDVEFDGFGIRISAVDEFNSKIAKVEYSSEIGKSDFKYSLAK